MQSNKIYSVVENDFTAVNLLITQRLNSNIPLIKEITHYILQGGGKRLRPLLVLLSAKSGHYQEQAHINLAAVIEILHTATLLHDDVVDSSKLRRGNATVNSLWGNSASVLAGDFLYTRAFEILVELGHQRILTIVAKGTNTMAEGEFLQLMNCRNPNATEHDYMAVIHHKTASLFQMAAHCGAIIANVNNEQEQALEQFGLHLGMAFQLVDDVLDYQGSTDNIGKNIGDDLAEGKPTLPIIYTLQHCTQSQAEMIQVAIKKGSLENLPAIQQAITASGSLEYTLNVANEHAAKAIGYLRQLPDSQYRQAMIDLVKFAIARTY